MELKFISIDSNSNRPKATVHVTGKLGFNMEAAKLMNFDENTYYRVAVDDTENAKKIYFVIATANDEATIKVAKAGQYYYINMANAFRSLGIDYETYIVSFDIDKGQYEGSKMFILTRRTKKEKLRESSDKSASDEEL
jgi:hypothetical protein